jgi:hypothetical protein
MDIPSEPEKNSKLDLALRCESPRPKISHRKRRQGRKMTKVVRAATNLLERVFDSQVE